MLGTPMAQWGAEKGCAARGFFSQIAGVRVCLRLLRSLGACNDGLSDLSAMCIRGQFT